MRISIGEASGLNLLSSSNHGYYSDRPSLISYKAGSVNGSARTVEDSFLRQGIFGGDWTELANSDQRRVTYLLNDQWIHQLPPCVRVLGEFDFLVDIILDGRVGFTDSSITIKIHPNNYNRSSKK